jgi:hypothetical protein
MRRTGFFLTDSPGEDGHLNELRACGSHGLLRELDRIPAARFGLIAYGLGDWFSPQVNDFEQAAFIAGSALATVGLSGIEAHGPARWVLVAAGICGLAVLTMAVTYLIEVQESISRRDAGVLKITTAGQPPSGLGLP